MISTQQKDELLKTQHESENEINQKMKHKHEIELAELKKHLAKKRQWTLEKLQLQQEQEKAEVFTCLPLAILISE